MDRNYKKAPTTDAKFLLNFGMYTYKNSLFRHLAKYLQLLVFIMNLNLSAQQARTMTMCSEENIQILLCYKPPSQMPCNSQGLKL
jgi:hypothetical protein